MTWLTERMIKEGPAKFPKEIGLLVPGVYKSLVDRNGDVSRGAWGMSEGWGEKWVMGGAWEEWGLKR